MNKWLRGLIGFLAFVGCFALTVWMFWPRPEAIVHIDIDIDEIVRIEIGGLRGTTSNCFVLWRTYPNRQTVQIFDAVGKRLSDELAGPDGWWFDDSRATIHAGHLVGDEISVRATRREDFKRFALNPKTARWRELTEAYANSQNDEQFSEKAGRVAIELGAIDGPLQFLIVDPKWTPPSRRVEIPTRRSSGTTRRTRNSIDAATWTFSDNGRWLAIADEWDGEEVRKPSGVELWDVETGTMVHRFPTDDFYLLTDKAHRPNHVGAAKLEFRRNDTELHFEPFYRAKKSTSKSIAWYSSRTQFKIPFFWSTTDFARHDRPKKKPIDDPKRRTARFWPLPRADRFVWIESRRHGDERRIQARVDDSESRCVVPWRAIPATIRHREIPDADSVEGMDGMLVYSPGDDPEAWASQLGTFSKRVPEWIANRFFPVHQYWWWDWKSDALYPMRTFTAQQDVAVQHALLPERIAFLIAPQDSDRATLEIWSAPPPRVHWLWNGVLSSVVGVWTVWRLGRRNTAKQVA